MKKIGRFIIGFLMLPALIALVWGALGLWGDHIGLIIVGVVVGILVLLIAVLFGYSFMADYPND
jgi:hypothetical protein